MEIRANTYIYALLPKGYDLARDTTGKLKTDTNGQYVAVKTPAKASAHPTADLSYVDEIANYVWPVSQDYFYWTVPSFFELIIDSG